MNRVLHVQRVLAAAFAVVALNVGRLQILQGPMYQRLAEQNHLRLLPSSAPRGRILDRTGLVLADNRPALNVVIVPQETAQLETTFSALARLLNRPAERLAQIYQAGRTLPFAPVMVAGDIPRDTALIIEERRQQLPGVFIQPQALRLYPEGAATAHVVGYIGDITAEELASLEEYGYQPRDRVGKTGIERQFDAYLRGEPGGTMVEVDHRGRFVRMRGVREPLPGQDVQLTINAWLQRQAARLLGQMRGACVVLDPRNGEVLALVSAPAFDPNVLLQSDSAAKRAILTGADSPMLQRASGAAFTPGSIFKIITATAALEQQRVTPLTTILCHGALALGTQAMKCWKQDGHGPEDMQQALAHSCNVYFGQAGLWTGPDALHVWALQYGLGRLTGIELPGEAAGSVPSPSWWVGHWYAGDTAHLAIGQGGLLVTPLQMAVMTAAVANGGWVVRPHLVRAVGGVAMASPSARHVTLHPETLAVINAGLRAVVEWSDGTGHRVFSPRIRIAGKTGTAQTQIAGSPHGWFVGYAPVDDPQLVVVVLAEHGGSGGERPSEIARQLFEAWAAAQADQPAVTSGAPHG